MDEDMTFEEGDKVRLKIFGFIKVDEGLGEVVCANLGGFVSVEFKDGVFFIDEPPFAPGVVLLCEKEELEHV